MTMTIVVIVGLLALVGALCVICAAIMLVILWIARGESDVNGDPERDADPNSANDLPGWDAEIMCAWCGKHLEGRRLPASGTTYFRLCDECRTDAESEIEETLQHEEVK